MATKKAEPRGHASPTKPEPRKKAKASPHTQVPATLTITALDQASLALMNERFEASGKFVADARSEANAVLDLVNPSQFVGNFVKVRDYLKGRPLSPQGVLALVLLAEERGRAARARGASQDRYGAAKAWVVEEWAKLSDDGRKQGKAAFARSMAPQVEQRFETASGKPLRINPDRIEKVWLKQ